MAEEFQNLLSHLESINNSINYLKEPSWIDVGNFVILAVTLGFLILYTWATQKMKEEMVRQRKMSNAHDVYFSMRSDYYLPANNSPGFGELRTAVSTSSISEFVFLSKKSKPIGRQVGFHRINRKDVEFTANYMIDNERDRQLFVATLKKQKGIIKAKVTATSGDKFLYTYKAIQDNYKRAEENPNLSDEFRLVGKKIIKDKTSP